MLSQQPDAVLIHFRNVTLHDGLTVVVRLKAGADRQTAEAILHSIDFPAAPAWQTIIAGDAFTFEAPADLVSVPVQGIDSLVGTLLSDTLEVTFDYGWYSGRFDGEAFDLQPVTVDGKSATFASSDDTVGIHFPDVDGRNKLTVVVRLKDGADRVVVGAMLTYARAGTGYDFKSSQMERGHMAQHEDNKAWGRDNVDAGCLMSNIVPQHKNMNGEAWLDIEEAHRSVVANPASGIEAVWVISGPVFEQNQPETTVGNGVGVPHATYKVVGWFDKGGKFHVRGYVVRQEDRVRDPKHYLRPVDEIEAMTGLDFFMDLEDGLERQLEAARHTTLWAMKLVNVARYDARRCATSPSVRSRHWG